MKTKQSRIWKNKGLAPEEYYFNEQGLMVFTEKYHLKRGYCCRNGCLHCPYKFKKEKRDPDGL